MGCNGTPNTCPHCPGQRIQSVCLVCGLYRAGVVERCQRCGAKMEQERMPR